jgi:plastocyanin
MKKIAPLLAVSVLFTTMTSAFAADITGTITLKGSAPKEKEITPLVADANCGKLHSTPPTTHFYVVNSQNQLADVIVSLQGVSGKSTGASAAPQLLDQKGCEYLPSIFAVQTGQKIVVKNSDPVGHNVHSHPTAAGNDEQNKMQAEKAPDLSFAFTKPETFLKFNCDIHAWMFSWACVFDHPYFAVSGKDGSFKIANVPPGKYTLQAAHRKAGVTTQEIEVKDGADTKVELSLEVK